VSEYRPITVHSVHVFFTLTNASIRQTLGVVVQATSLQTAAHSASKIAHKFN